MLHNPIVAGFELSPTQTFFFFAMIVVFWLFVAAAACFGVWLLVQSVLAIKRPVAKNGFQRRKVIAIIWLFAILLVGGVLVYDSVYKSQGRSYNRELSVAYAKTYKHPVVLPKTQDYMIAFEQKWGQIDISSASDAQTVRFNFVQVPFTEANRKYFDVKKGLCNFGQMRENWDKPEPEDEQCQLWGKANDFRVYKSSGTQLSRKTRYYAQYKEDVVIWVDADEANVMSVVRDLRVTDAAELASVFESDHYNPTSYPAALDRWRKEGKF